MPVIVGALIAFAMAQPLQPGLEQEARQIESMLIAPCCFSQQVSEHHSEAAERIRADIRVRLAAGESRQEILNAYVQQYGRRVLADPSPEGFGQLLVIVPVLTLALTAVALGLLVRRFARRGAAVHAPAAADGPASVVRRLDDELRDMD